MTHDLRARPPGKGGEHLEAPVHGKETLAERNAVAERTSSVAAHAEEVRALAKTAIPGAATMTLASDQSALAKTRALEAALHAQLGAGEEAGFERWAGEHRYQMLQFVQALAGTSSAAEPERADFIRLAIAALAAQLPGATFSLVLADDSLIAASVKGATTVWKVDPTAFGRGQDLVAIVEDAGLAAPWYSAFQKLSGKTFAGLDAGTATRTLRRARDFSIGVEGGAVVAAVLQMAHADQARFIQAFDKATGFAPGRGRVAGGLAVQTTAPAKAVATAPADHLATGAVPREVTVTTSLDSVTETHRNWRFVDMHYRQIVGAQLGQHTLRGTEPRTLAGTDLENEIGVAMGEQPDHLPKTDPDLERLEQRAWNCFQGNARVKAVANKIRDKGGDVPSVLVVPIVFDARTAADTGLVQFSVFRVGDSIIDHTARVYHSVSDWKKHNTLPPGRISYPKQLALHETSPGQLDYTTEDTHAKHPSNREKAEAVLDTAALVGGIVLGGAAIIGTGGTALAIAGGVTAAYGVARSAETLDDRAAHEQSINPFTNSDARAEWLSFGANALAVASLGTTKLPSVVAKAAKLADTGAQVNAANDLRREWSSLTPAERAQLGLQLGYWGLQRSMVGRQTGHEAAPVETPDGKPAGWRRRLFGGAPTAHETIADVVGKHDPVLAEIATLRIARISTIAEICATPELLQFSVADRVAILRFLIRDTPGGKGANADHMLAAFTSHPAAKLGILRSAVSSPFVATEWHPELGALAERQHVTLGPVEKITKPGGSHIRYALTLGGGHVIDVVQLAPGSPPKGYRHPTALEVQHVLAAQPPGALVGIHKLYLTSTPYEGAVLGPDRVKGGPIASSRFNEGVTGLFTPRDTAGFIKVRPIELDTVDPQAALQRWQQTLTHELAHSFDFERGGRKKFAAEHDPAYAAAIARDGRAISGYAESAKHDPSEDFAETYSLYVGVHGTPREATMRALYPHRFAYLDRALAMP